HIVLPAALPGYVAGLKQGWAFSWRSLMAAEIIASFPDLGIGLGQLLGNGRNASDMAMVFEAILLILTVGIAIDLLLFSALERWVLRSRGLLVKGCGTSCNVPYFSSSPTAAAIRGTPRPCTTWCGGCGRCGRGCGWRPGS